MGIYTNNAGISYKVVQGVAIRLKSSEDIDYNNINDKNINDAVYRYENGGYDIITKKSDDNTIGDTLRSMGYKITIGGKKSRKNRKHKRKSATKRRTARKHAY